ncbi:MAG: sigma factor-like helix-turn-helix DNA-binding protein [Firmicutes bacterium]|nr:sigma factor-like helix-turn-helix DNA-binding protein [Bacillota bacterium]
MEKFTKISLLLDIYGNLLKGRRREVINLHYNEDYSLTEIAEIFNITKQGVRDFLLKGEKELLDYEESLGILANKFEMDEILSKIIESNDINFIKSSLKKLIYYQKE